MKAPLFGIATFACLIAGPLATIAAAGMIYDFESCTAGYIQGQDNWTAYTNGIETRNAPKGGAPHPGSGMCATTYGGTTNYWGARQNDGNWSYDVSGGQPFYLQADMVTDYDVGGYYGHGKIYLTSSATGRRIGMGIEVLPWYYAPLVSNALNTETNGGQPRPTARNQTFKLRLDVDPSGYGGEGTATLSIMRTGLGETDFQEVSGLENVNLYMATAVVTAAQMDGLRMEIDTRLVAIDNIEVGVIPEPSTFLLAILALPGLLAISRRRKR